jgi:hypothetical protein
LDVPVVEHPQLVEHVSDKVLNAGPDRTLIVTLAGGDEGTEAISPLILRNACPPLSPSTAESGRRWLQVVSRGRIAPPLRG